MAGLVPAIHVFTCALRRDARHKAGHDGVKRRGLVASTVRMV
jgi:hypothetical protein